MFRRDFIQHITVAGCGSLAAVPVKGGQGATVRYTVKGFSCVTCAVGLEVMLRQQNGVLRATASYPDATVVIHFDPNTITERALKEFIATKGFKVEDHA